MKPKVVAFIVGMAVGGFVAAILLSSPADGDCVIESKRPIVPHVQAFSEDGWTWDTLYTYRAQ